MQSFKVSVVLPAKNESASLQVLLPKIKAVLPDAEILVINDGSTDDTVKIAEDAGARVVSPPLQYG